MTNAQAMPPTMTSDAVAKPPIASVGSAAVESASVGGRTGDRMSALPKSSQEGARDRSGDAGSDCLVIHPDDRNDFAGGAGEEGFVGAEQVGVFQYRLAHGDPRLT